jgi:hypothetical protein
MVRVRRRSNFARHGIDCCEQQRAVLAQHLGPRTVPDAMLSSCQHHCYQLI